MTSLSQNSHLDKVLAHAERKLASKGRKTTAGLLELYKKFLKIENHRLRLEHHAGGGGLEMARRRANLMDVIIRHLFEGAGERPPAKRTSSAKSTPSAERLAIIAIGGYGRGELNPFSDVDIMFLHDAKGAQPGEHTASVIEQVLYLLWDVGFKVGHSTRSIAGAVEQANQDMLSKTSLLESRCIAGDAELAVEFEKVFQAECVKGYEEPYIAWRVENQRERHEKFGGTVHLQEPNVKNGCGGLRDYQNLRWVSHFKVGARSFTRLVEQKFLTESERRSLNRAHDFLLRVRTELHYVNKRATDVLTLYFQGQIATKFEYPGRSIVKRSEAFMRDYYQHTRNLFLITRTVAERLSLVAKADSVAPRIFNFLARRKAKRETFDGFMSEGGMIFPEQKDPFREDPQRMMRVFQHAQQRHLHLSPELQQLIRRRTDLVTRTFQYGSAARKTFEAILSRKGQVGRILRMMHEVDFLGRYLPEFGELTCLVQHEFFHRYTADEHTLVAVEKLDMVIDTPLKKFAGYRTLFQKLEDPYVLYMAILLHDTGKASGGRHHEQASAVNALRVAARLQFSPDRRRQLVFLVDNHMTLSNTAQRRNVEDPATICEFGNILKSQKNLDALMLLTLADGQATAGEQTWSDWKESLVWRLYRSGSEYIENGVTSYRERVQETRQKVTEVAEKLGETYREEIQVHFDSMPENYLFAYESPDISTHIRLFRSFFTHLRKTDPVLALKPIVKWIAHPDQGHSEVLVVTWDRDELLARLACCFASVKLNILSADIYTRTDNLVLDVFRVCTTDFQSVSDPKDIERFEAALLESTSREDFDFQSLLEKARRKTPLAPVPDLDFPTRITINADAHPKYTLVDIQTPDRLGLLYELLRAFADAKVNIGLSRIATEKGAAIDTFYVTDHLGKKLNETAQIVALQQTLQRTAAAGT